MSKGVGEMVRSRSVQVKASAGTEGARRATGVPADGAAGEAGPMPDLDAVDTGLRPRQVQRLRHVRGLHRRPQRPGHNVARGVIQHRGQGVPAPADDLQGGEVRLPELVRSMRRMLERFPGRQQAEGRARNQVIGPSGCDTHSIPTENGPPGPSAATPALAATAPDPLTPLRRRARAPAGESGSSPGTRPTASRGAPPVRAPCSGDTTYRT